MKNNTSYNLMCQLVQEQKSLWRISDVYLKDAKGSKDVIAFWKKMKTDKEDHIKELTMLIKKHLE